MHSARVTGVWHPPGPSGETYALERSAVKLLLPPGHALTEGAVVGDTTGDVPHEIRFPSDLLHRHHLYVARTRTGTSTLKRHIVAHKLRD